MNQKQEKPSRHFVSCVSWTHAQIMHLSANTFTTQINNSVRGNLSGTTMHTFLQLLSPANVSNLATPCWLQPSRSHCNPIPYTVQSLLSGLCKEICMLPSHMLPY